MCERQIGAEGLTRRRRLYEITAAGRAALARVAAEPDGAIGLDPGWSPT